MQEPGEPTTVIEAVVNPTALEFAEKEIELTKCPVCQKPMDAFVVSERGRCNNCGADTEDFAQLANLFLDNVVEVQLQDASRTGTAFRVYNKAQRLIAEIKKRYGHD